jgi:hypothetical protein
MEIGKELKLTKPYMLVIHTKIGKSAVYNRNYERIFEGASQELIDYAKKNNTQVRPGFKLTLPEQQPSWVLSESEMEDQCICYHLYNDVSKTSEIKKIPNW